LDYAPANAAINRDANGHPISDAYSLVQVQYVNGRLQTTYTSAYNMVKNYIASYPRWVAQPGKALTVLGQDALIIVPTVASPGPRGNNTASFGQASDDKAYAHLAGLGVLSFFASQGQIASSGSAPDIIQYGTKTALNQECTVRFAVHDGSDVFGLVSRVKGSSASTISAYAFILHGNTLSLVKIVNGASTVIANQPFSQIVGAYYRMRFRVTESSPAKFKARIWAEGKQEPGTWNITTSDANSPLPLGGFGIYVKATTSHPVVFDSLAGVDATSIAAVY
jgi:hypothetical protein